MPPVVVVRPLSGYINRLQAIASSLILAQELGSRLWIDWEPSEVAPVAMSDVLDPAFATEYGRSVRDIVDAVGVDPREVPPYLHHDTARSIVTLAGLDKGEQTFMPELRRILGTQDLKAIVISAGGKFTLHAGAALAELQAATFRHQRQQAYAQMSLRPEIEQAARDAISARESFAALHLRYSDRSLESPWQRQIEPAVRTVADVSGSRSLFIASDTSAEKERWHQRARSMGLDPWSADPSDFPRSDPRSAWGALIDWRILTRSSAMAYFAASSFAEEAAVASGRFDEGVGLVASRSRRSWMKGRQLARATVTFPRRHGWLRS